MSNFSAADVLDVLRSSGGDVNRPHLFEFFLYLPTQDAAVAAYEELADLGFACEVRPPLPGSKEWLCLSKLRLVPTDDRIDAIGMHFQAMAARAGGEFDGWGAEQAAP